LISLGNKKRFSFPQLNFRLYLTLNVVHSATWVGSKFS
jgi:hypothetical protein